MKWILNILVSLLLVSGAVYVAIWFYQTRPRPQKKERDDPGTLVEVIEAQPGEHRVVVVGMGTVVPSRELILQPEVSGRLVDVHPRMVPGGILPEATTVLRIDARDYELLLSSRKADEARARFELELELGRQKVAQREFELLASDLREGATDRALALRQPHLRSAKAALAAAESGVQKAELDLQRTEIQVPFNCLVRMESTEIGQLVSPQMNLATLVGTDTFWVQVSIPVDRLMWIRGPSDERVTGAAARILQETTGAARIERRGRVIRLLGDLDPVGRLARVLVEIEDPMGLEGPSAGSDLPLLLGAYVRVEIEGEVLDGVFRLPRLAVRDGDQVWIAGEDDRLEIREVEIAWKGEETVLVESGLGRGDRIVTSPIPIPMQGMKLRQAESLARRNGSAARSEASEEPRSSEPEAASR